MSITSFVDLIIQQKGFCCGSKQESDEIHLKTVGLVINSLTKDQRQNVYSGNYYNSAN